MFVDYFFVFVDCDFGVFVGYVLVVEVVIDGLDLFDDVEVGCCGDGDVLVVFVFLVCDECMYWCLEVECGGVCGNVVDVVVGD